MRKMRKEYKDNKEVYVKYNTRSFRFYSHVFIALSTSQVVSRVVR